MSSTPQEPGNPQDPAQAEQGAPQQGAAQRPAEQPSAGQQPAAPQYGAPPSAPGAPQYGAQPGYGQQAAPEAPQYGATGYAPPQYGQGTPAAPQWPSESPYAGPSSAMPRPQKVEISFWLIVVAGVLNLVSGLIGAFTISSNSQFDAVVRQMQESGSSAPDADALRSMVVVMTLVFGVIQLALYLLVAFFVRKGANWARILGTVFAALSLINLASGVFGIIVTLMGVAAIVLLYLKDTSPYFKRPKY
ncbi:hypothetical protein [Arthrobacter sp. NPDC090010]|uniref:hypothetical protein n=1 Tax=Arthrobacter sp. NPDC090010 TaxID=3363942 RepID=UPI003814CA89